MKLTKYRVTNFRSVDDSGWIDAGTITTLVGTNESGKTNMIIPLWKLNPSEDCLPDLIQDMPRKKYHSMRNSKNKPIFITGCFKLERDELGKLSTLAGSSSDVSFITSVLAGKDYDNQVFLEFTTDSIQDDFFKVLLQKTKDAHKELNILLKAEAAEKREAIIESVSNLALMIGNPSMHTLAEETAKLKAAADAIDPENLICSKSLQEIKEMLAFKYLCTQLGTRPEIKQLIMSGMPKFVYYSSYGNIDSEIYLPQVISNFQRTNLGVKEAAKVRTLKMLFDFVKLDPVEIQTLGKDSPKGNLTEEQIKLITKQKKEREILLQSAATEFTTRFRNWWKQGAYTFDFQADGDFFRIWVSDELRSDKIELESRSTGLQWFFSFYLTFLIQSDNKSNIMLLLDEPGLTLHPLAQKDLFEFFEGLSEKCQIIYSTHSPYLISTNHLSRVTSVFIDEAGYSTVSNDLRNSSRVNQIKSVYPVHSALNMLISESMLASCIPVIVDSISDLIYLSTLKNYLVGQGELKTNREIVFVPSGGVAGIKAVLPILVGKNAFMPFVVLGGTPAFIEESRQLKNGIFKGHEDNIFNIGGFGIENAQIEDLVPSHIMQKILMRVMPRSPYSEEEFDDVYTKKLPVVDQVLTFAQGHDFTMQSSWRQELASKVKLEILKQTDNIYKDDKVKFEAVKSLFTNFAKLF